MRNFVSFRSKGQTMVLVALAAIALIAFVALAVDGGNAYGIRREAQSAADAGAIAGTWVMVDYPGGPCPGCDVLIKVNEYAEMNGVPDTHPGDDIRNDNIEAYWVYFDGSCVPVGATTECQELHTWTDIPAGAKGVHVLTHISTTTFFARAIGIGNIGANARATATYNPDGGILPIAVNEYWLGSQGHCPYANCGEPYSFVRDPSQLPPFSSTDGGLTWERNFCPDPYNDNTCQGPYEGTSENYGKAFAILGADAKPNYGSSQPRSGVMLDSRYDALENGGNWYLLVNNDAWLGPNTASPVADGQGADEMAEVMKSGGYSKKPIPRAVHEPPIDYITNPSGWSYCWALPHNEDNCFNYPASSRGSPYDTLQFLSGAKASFLAKTMYDDGNYVDGRFAPGERIVILVYNSVAGDQWGSGGNKSDAATVVGYFGARIVGYGNDFDHPCNGTPGDWASYTHCLKGNVNTTYAVADNDAPLVIDPSKLLNEFLPKKITLIHGAMDQ